MHISRYRFRSILATIAIAVFQSSCSHTDQPKPPVASVQPPLKSGAALTTGTIPRASQDAAVVEKITNVTGAVHRAVDWHPSIQQAVGELRQQGEVVADARSGYLPSIGGGVDLQAQNDTRGDWGPRFNLTASQMLYDFGKVSGKVEAESAVRDARKAEFLTAVDDVIRDTAEAWVEVLRNQALATVAQQQITDVQGIGKLVDARTDSGASTRSDKLQAQARVQAAQSTALEITAQQRRWGSTLVSLLGGAPTARPSGSFPAALDRACAGPEPDWDTVPTVVAAQSHKREADANVKLARANMLPTVALEASSRVKTWDPSDDPEYVFGVTIKGDLYNGGAFKARQNAAKYAAQASEAAVAAGRFDAQKTWIESAGQVTSMRALLTSLASRQPMMRETRNLYQAQFLDLGTRTLLDVLNADQELHSARFDEINTRYDLYKLEIECGYSAGKLRDIFGLSSTPPAEAADGKTEPAEKPTAAAARKRPGGKVIVANVLRGSL